jgi:tight adherence protein B
MRTVFILLLSLAIVAGLEAAYYGVRHLLQRRSMELKRRLQSLGQAGTPESSLLRRGRLAAAPALDTLLRAMRPALWAERLLEAADSRLTVAQLWVYSASLAFGGFALTLALGFPFVLVLLVVGGSGAVPTLLLLASAERRNRKLSEQLPEALDMMSRSLRAGHAISAAFQMVAGEMPEPVSVEFGRAFEEQRLGLPLEQAIRHMTERLPKNRDLKILAVSTIIQKETGGNLAGLLSGIAETIRARYRFEGKVRALTAEGRASGVILSLMPVAFAFILGLLNPGYFAPLLTDPTGKLVTLCAVGAWLTGVLWLYRLTKVDL